MSHTWAPLKGHGIEPVLPMFLHKQVRHGSLTLPGAMLVRPQPMCPHRKFLNVASFGQSVPCLLCPLPNHPIPKYLFFNCFLNIILGGLYGCDSRLSG
jgi:hypothetical protein